ncbi:hypothetical protein FACS189472_10640 [Alphaproteobacteria bacterium]|nr:hypothetical protein FACS189472_10640 [Alphaproteobacteria bacterium]
MKAAIITRVGWYGRDVETCDTAVSVSSSRCDGGCKGNGGSVNKELHRYTAVGGIETSPLPTLSQSRQEKE